MTDWRSEVGSWWAQRLGLPRAALLAGGIYGAPVSGHVGLMAVTGADQPLGYGPLGAARAAAGHDRPARGTAPGRR